MIVRGKNTDLETRRRKPNDDRYRNKHKMHETHDTLYMTNVWIVELVRLVS